MRGLELHASILTFNPNLLNPECIGSYTWTRMKVREAPSSYNYLCFAKQDVEDGRSPRHLVNALGNAKRAIHMRLEDVCLGFGALTLKGLGSHPQLIEYVRKCGLVAPNILKRVNDLRNEVEHQFQIPPEQEVENVIDVAELFLDATDRWIARMPSEIDYNQEVTVNGYDICVIGLKLEWEKGIALVSCHDQGNRNNRHTVKFDSRSVEFFQCIKFLLENQ